MTIKFIFKLFYLYLFTTVASTEDRGWQQPPSNDSVREPLPSEALFDNIIHVSPHHINRTCQVFLAEFARQSSMFIKCVVDNARPFRLCESCVDPFKKAATLFTDLNHNGDCYKAIVMADRVQVVRLVYENVRNVWTSANCEDCFASIHEDSASGLVNSTMTNNTLQFLSLFNNTMVCLNATKQELEPSGNGNSSFCDICQLQYKSLNTHFAVMMKNSSSKVCMDVVDMMNYTRLMWSKTYNCSHRRGDQVPILIIATFICSLPIIFYVVNRLTGQQAERTIVVQKRMKHRKAGTYGSLSSSTQRTVSFSQSIS